MLNLKRQTKIILVCSVFLSLLLISSWAFLDITTYNLDESQLWLPKTSSVSEICRPCSNINLQWDSSHYNRIDENITCPDGTGDGVKNYNAGYSETKTDEFELEQLYGGNENLDSITIYTLCCLWAGHGGYSQLKVSYRICLNGQWSEWSSQKVVSSTFSFTWKTFTWDNLGIWLEGSTSIKLRVKLVSRILSTRYGGDVYVDAMYGELGFNDKLDWGVDNIDAEEVWGGSEDALDVLPGLYAGAGVNVCIIDSGIDTDHLDLIGNYKGGYDFIENDTIPEDSDGHGTHCAGIIGAIDNELGVIGVAPKVNLYICRVSQGGWLTQGNATRAVQWAIDNHMNVISMSFGGGSSNNDLEDALEDAHNAGIVLVAASGNYDVPYPPDEDETLVQYPARYSNVIAVGALKPTLYRWFEMYQNYLDDNKWYQRGSCYGSGLDISAPGVNILSTYLAGDYTDLTGTSMACPMVAGVCGLILSVKPDLTPEEVEECICETAEKVRGDYDETKTYGSWDEEYGYGMVNATAAVNYAIDNF